MFKFTCYLYVACLPLIANAQTLENHTICSGAEFLCSTTPVISPTLYKGLEEDPVFVSCLQGKPFPMSNAKWFRWQIAQGGTLSFNIVPFDTNDDFDFVLFRAESNTSTCRSRKELRCMAAGANLGEMNEHRNDANCLGTTGLREETQGLRSAPGCNIKNDNFLSTVSALPGETYLLLVNNFSSNKGFLLEFTGTATFDPLGRDCTKDAIDVRHSDPGHFEVGPITPNPVIEQIQLDVFAPTNAEYCVVSVFSSNGIFQRYERFDLIPGVNKCLLDVANLPQGVYYLRVGSGDETRLLRFVKI